MSLRHDISQYYTLKVAIEQLLGHQAWLDLKECTSFTTWRTYILRLIEAIRVSIHESVEIKDEAWMIEVNKNLNHGKKMAKSSKGIEELISAFTATLLRQVFLQIGIIPNRASTHKVTLRRENWRLNKHRSVLYVQSPAQVESIFWSEQQREIGFERQMELLNEYKSSKSKKPYSQWCRKHKV